MLNIMANKIAKIKDCTMQSQPNLINEVYVDGKLFATVKHVNNYTKMKLANYLKKSNITQEQDNILQLTTSMIQWGIQNLITDWAHTAPISIQSFEQLTQQYQDQLIAVISKVISQSFKTDQAIEKN